MSGLPLPMASRCCVSPLERVEVVVAVALAVPPPSTLVRAEAVERAALTNES